MAKAFQESLCTGSTCRRKSYLGGEVSQSLLTTLAKEDNHIVGETWQYISLGLNKLQFLHVALLNPRTGVLGRVFRRTRLLGGGTGLDPALKASRSGEL